MMKFAFHHVGVAVQDLAEASSTYKTLFGYELVSGPFDDPIQNVSVCFLSRGEGDTLLEIVAPLGPNSPIDRTLKNGGGTYHICYRGGVIGAAIPHPTNNDWVLRSGPVPAVVLKRRPMA